MTDISGSLVRFVLAENPAIPVELRTAVADFAMAYPAQHDEHLAALRSTHPEDDLRMRALDAAAGLAYSGVHTLVAATAAVAGIRHAANADRATVLGCEVACRLAAALGARPEALAVVGAALAGSTEPVAARHALGLAATQVTTVSGSEEPETTALRAAFAAADGIEAAMLGERGFTAPAQPIEGRRGLLALLAPSADGETLLHDLGKRWFAAEVLGARTN
ncbi:MmgE/PrpD family protein [Saccharopolyspora sp. K220]|uniref:MmgE/PrpD family protein n=1 Tax=Saccharopolyspora soli TaxID=2926618 RepID=UPI001F566936|nr:MmgE/PrpD family protein [Saccharopolyspora soli]MCI2416399.1 MmgE/PrpD family protein [Saccharopolyspora soli]